MMGDASFRRLGLPGKETGGFVLPLRHGRIILRPRMPKRSAGERSFPEIRFTKAAWWALWGSNPGHPDQKALCEPAPGSGPGLPHWIGTVGRGLLLVARQSRLELVRRAERRMRSRHQTTAASGHGPYSVACITSTSGSLNEPAAARIEFLGPTPSKPGRDHTSLAELQDQRVRWPAPSVGLPH
jgi:hypothetical protein